MKKFLAAAVALAALLPSASAQDYSFKLQPTAEIVAADTLDNGAVRLTFAGGTDLNALGLSAVMPAGAKVAPDPATARIRDNEPELFTVTYADGTQKVYPFYFTTGRWFTVVLFGDPEVDMAGRENNHASVEALSLWADHMLEMCTNRRYAFKAYPEYKIGADLVICMGDMDSDSKQDPAEIDAVLKRFVDAGIPTITMCGNHDLVPDYWGNSDRGLTWGPTGGANANKVALSLVTKYLDSAKTLGVENVKRFTQANGGVQIEPFTFTFKGVRFYVGQTYWFQKPYDSPGLFSAAKYYAPNGVIAALDEFVSTPEVAATPSVWVQHYPINCEDRWWTDQDALGQSIAPQDTPDYATASEKREKYKSLIAKTTNPVHFSGHNHWDARTEYTKDGKRFYDYTAPYFANRSGCYIALCHEGEGVVEVQIAYFDY